MAGPLVVDTSALIAILLAEPDALRFAQALHGADELRMSAPSWLEAAQVATGRRGVQGYAQFDEKVTRQIRRHAEKTGVSIRPGSGLPSCP